MIASKVQWQRKEGLHFSPLARGQKAITAELQEMTGFLLCDAVFFLSVQRSSAVFFQLHSRSVQCTSPLKGVRCYCTAYALRRELHCRGDSKEENRKTFGRLGTKPLP